MRAAGSLAIRERAADATMSETKRPYRRRMPLRVEIYGDVVGRIRDGELRPGTQLPGEHDLAEQYLVSRTVVREAMILLEEDHWIENRPGSGRFVAASIPAVGLQQLRPLNELLAEQLGGVRSQVLQVVEEPANDFVAGRLGTETGTPVTLVEYVIEDREERRLAYSLEWLPSEVISRDRLEEAFVESGLGTLSALGLRPWRGHLTLGATTAGAHRGRLLRIPARTAILLLESTVTDANGRTALVSKHHLRPDIVRLSLTQDP